MSGEREDAGSSRLQPTPVAPSRGGEGERLDLDALEKVARAAGPETWSVDPSSGIDLVWDGRQRIAQATTRRFPAIAEHIATFDPPTVLRLIGERRDALGALTQALAEKALALPVEDQYALAVRLATNCGYELREEGSFDAMGDEAVCAEVRRAAQHVTGGNCAFVIDDIAILQHLATRAADAGLVDGLHPHLAQKTQRRTQERSALDDALTTPPPPDPQVPDDRSRDDIESNQGDVT